MPHSLIEAFASGLPVVTTPAGGIPYVVEDGRNGLFVPVDDAEAMAAAVLRILDDAELAGELIAEGAADVEARYSWTAARRRWASLYRELVGSAASAESPPETAEVA